MGLNHRHSACKTDATTAELITLYIVVSLFKPSILPPGTVRRATTRLVELEDGVEPTTSDLEGQRSATELFQQNRRLDLYYGLQEGPFMLCLQYAIHKAYLGEFWLRVPVLPWFLRFMRPLAYLTCPTRNNMKRRVGIAPNVSRLVAGCPSF